MALLRVLGTTAGVIVMGVRMDRRIQSTSTGLMQKWEICLLQLGLQSMVLDMGLVFYYN
jgi:hypothetical protein